MHCGQTGAPAVGNFTTNTTVIFSGFSAKNADDAKSSVSFMEGGERYGIPSGKKRQTAWHLPENAV